MITRPFVRNVLAAALVTAEAVSDSGGHFCPGCEQLRIENWGRGHDEPEKLVNHEPILEAYRIVERERDSENA